MVKPDELLHKGSGIKAVFSLAPLPRRPCTGEFPCSLPNHLTLTTSFPGRLTEVRTPEVATGVHVRPRIGRLTLGLTVADRWECSQAAGLPTWHHQDLSTPKPLGHTVSRALKQKNLYLGTGPSRTLCRGMYTATQGALVFDSVMGH